MGTMRPGSVAGRRARPPHEEDHVSLNAPSQIVFIIAAILAIVGLLGGLNIVAAVAAYATWLAFAGWLVLAVGCFMKGM